MRSASQVARSQEIEKHVGFKAERECKKSRDDDDDGQWTCATAKVVGRLIRITCSHIAAVRVT